MSENLLVDIVSDVDSYKSSHFLQYPPGMTSMFSYFESRGGEYEETLFFGLQYYLKRYLTHRVTEEEVREAEKLLTAHGLPFPTVGWMYIAKVLGGKLPVRIRAVPEGSLVPTGNVLMTVESTNPIVPWVVNWLETLLVRVWYPTTVATKSHSIKQIIKNYMYLTSDSPEEGVEFKLHDFGSRGVSSQESALIGGMGHLVNFRGTDTVAALIGARKYYGCEMAGFSIPASEHSTVTAWGPEGESDFYLHYLHTLGKNYPMFASVSDSYNLWNAIDMWGDLKGELKNAGSVLVVRPDSGDPGTVVPKVLMWLGERFGCTVNSKQFRVLDGVRVVQGDGMSGEQEVERVLQAAIKAGFSVENLAFGMGGGLLQQVNRDTCKFAFKCSNVTVDSQYRDVWKDPVTDSGKASKRGRLDLVRFRGEERLTTVPLRWGMKEGNGTVMRTVYEDGEVLVDDTLDEIRERVG